MLLAGSPVTLLAGSPVMLLAGSPVTLLAGPPVMLLAGPPVTLLAGPPVMLLAGLSAEPCHSILLAWRRRRLWTNLLEELRAARGVYTEKREC